MGREDEGWRDEPPTRPTDRERTLHHRREAARLAHCGRSGCGCPHTDCYRGWIDRTDADGHDYTTPCPGCRPTTAQRLGSIPPPGQRSGADFAALRGSSGFE